MRHLALNTSFSGKRPHRLEELILVQGSDEILRPPDPLLLFGLETLEHWTIPIIGHDPPVEFSGFSQGITPSIDGNRTIAVLLSWVGKEERSRFIDPEQPSYGTIGCDEYEQLVASKLRELEAQGAIVDSYLCYFETWYPPREHKTRRRCCTMM